MILTYQPGGNESDFINKDRSRFESKDFSVTKNEFIEAKYRMSERVRNFFGPIGIKYLEKSVILPIIFFRAKNIFTWESYPKSLEIEKMCFVEIKEIIQIVKPKKIFIIGIKTHEKIKTFLQIENETIIYSRPHGARTERMVISSTINQIPAFSIIHLTGSRIGTNHMNHIKQVFINWLEN